MMRNFDERKQEILRRAEEKICRRKKVRTQILGISIPLVCLAVCVAVLWPVGSTARNNPVCQESAMAAMDAVPAIPDLMDSHAGDEQPENKEAWRVEASVADAPKEDFAYAVSPVESMPFEPGMDGLLIVTPGENFTDYDGAYVLPERFDLIGGNIDFAIWNQSGVDVHIDSYDLLFREDEAWGSCIIYGQIWNEEPMCVSACRNGAADYNRVNRAVFDFTKPGTYRYKLTFRVGEDPIEYTMWAEFTLEEGE